MNRTPGFDRMLRCLGERITVDALVLFGSRARNDAFETSDWDVAVISRDFDGLNPLERGLRVLECPPPEVELVHLTPDELMQPGLSYLRCALLEEGVPLVDQGAFAAAREKYEERKAAGQIVFSDPVIEFR